MWSEMMWSGSVWRECLLAFLGFSAGLSVAGGVITVFTAVGLVPRFAEHTKTGDHIMKYENMIILGCFLGNLFSLFAGFSGGLQLLQGSGSGSTGAGAWATGSGFFALVLLGIAGIFTGIYVGTLAISIAEMLDAIPIMTHRINVKQGVSLVIAGLAAGKLIGSLFYYMNGVYGW